MSTVSSEGVLAVRISRRAGADSSHGAPDARRALLQLALALALILVGGLIAWRTQTAGGTVSVRDVRWVTPSGMRMSALLYVPATATVANPAPGIVAIHGYINSRETQSGFAIEFARRGYVVLAIDQTGHGYSDPPTFAGGFGGPAALTYLRSLDFVDRDNIGLEGHSMGGWASGMAAAAMPDDYRSIVIQGSSTGSSGVPAGTPEWPRNIAVVFSIWDEFSGTMWGSPIAANVGRTDKMKALFDTEADVEPGRIYGSIPAGTARALYQPRTNHPGDHLSSEAIGYAVDWFGMTLEGGSDLPASDQIWKWKEFGTLLGAIGMVLLLFPVGALLLRTDFFADLRREPVATRPASRLGWWGAAVFTAVAGPLTLFTFKDLPGTIGWSASPLFPQSITNSVIAWTTALAGISIVLFAVWHVTSRRTAPPATDEYGLTWDGRSSVGLLAKSFLLALLVTLAAYATLLATDFLFKTDFRFWVFGIKPLSPLQLRIALAYFLPFAFFFLVLAMVMHAQLRRNDVGAVRAYATNLAILTLGYVGLYIYQYAPLLTGGTLAIPNEPLWTIVSYQLLPIMTIVALVLTWFGRNTGRVYAGGFLSAMLVTWIVVASQATQIAP